MANRNEIGPGNVPGRFYVDNTCIDCDMCRNTAPRIFRRNDELGVSVVYHQPESEEELAEALEGLQSCPTETIGNDG